MTIPERNTLVTGFLQLMQSSIEALLPLNPEFNTTDCMEAAQSLICRTAFPICSRTCGTRMPCVEACEAFNWKCGGLISKHVLRELYPGGTFDSIYSQYFPDQSAVNALLTMTTETIQCGLEISSAPETCSSETVAPPQREYTELEMHVTVSCQHLTSDF